MIERRRVKRTQVFKHARILPLDSACEFDCVICDVTNLGAGLRVPPSASTPQTFELVFGSALFRRRCEVKWALGQRLGVSFVEV
jgi:hypothetical protein